MALCLGIAMVFGCVSQARALLSVEQFGGASVSFSEKFTRAYEAAAIHFGDSNPFIAFEKMLDKYKLPHEQAELEVTLGFRYGSTPDLQNPAKATEHLGKALTHDLSPTVRVQVHLWRGNSFEQLKQRKEALLEYLNGMLICLNHPLPKTKPVPPAFEVYSIEHIGPADAAFQEAERKKVAEFISKMQRREQALFDLKMADLRYSVIDACQRFGGDSDNVRATAKTIVKDEARIQQLVDLFKQPNKRAWN